MLELELSAPGAVDTSIFGQYVTIVTFTKLLCEMFSKIHREKLLS